MNHFLLFTKHLDHEGCFCLKLDADGAVIAPPAQRPFTEIQTLQNDCDTLVIEASTYSSLLNLELPWLPERKARIAIPYALEDKLAQPVDELHFAFDKTRYQNNSYLIAVMSKRRVRYIMQMLTENNIEFSAITLDWFALEPQELCVTESTLLVNMEDFKGALSGDLAESYLKKNHLLSPPLLFADSKIHVDEKTTQSTETSFIWIAQRILKSKPMNLCQGEMQHGKKSDWVKKGYQIAGALFCLWLVSLIAINSINLYFLNKQTRQIDEQIAVIYREFFPDAKQVISPKFRIGELLKSNNAEGDRFWYLLNQFSKVMNSKKFTLEQLRYQNRILSVTLVSSDFASLEKLENQLKKLPIKVKQTQASSREQQVVATMELS